MSHKGHFRPRSVRLNCRPASASPPEPDTHPPLAFIPPVPVEEPSTASIARIALGHSINSSARERSEYGIVRPKALPVVGLILNSNLAGCSTGRTAVFAPLDI